MAAPIQYYGTTLMPGSQAHSIVSEKKEGWEKKIKEHMKNLDNNQKALIADATRFEEKERAKYVQVQS